MKVKQFVMAYGVEQDRLRAILPDGFVSLRPVLRINAEVIDETAAYVEFNTAVEFEGNKGWLNIGFWNNVAFEQNGKATIFKTEHLTISFTGEGVIGSCPAEKDNAGCYFLPSMRLRLPESITSNKEFCDCEFSWDFDGTGTSGKSIGQTLPAIPTEEKKKYPKVNLTVANAATIPCECVLGAYMVEFER